MKKNLFLSTSVLLSVFATISMASAQTIPANIAPQIGTIQQQDIDSVKRLEQEKRGIRDYQNRQVGKEKKATEQKKKQPKATEPAKPEEYETKGVYIKKIEIPKSEILSDEEISNVLKDYEKTNMTMSDIKGLVEKINELYLNKGYVTARAYLPEQTIESGQLKIALMEGKVGKITIEGNRWTNESHIKDRLDIGEGEIFNIRKLEENMLIYNRYNDNIALKGDLQGGEKEGTTDVKTKVEEKAPYHVIAVADNAGRETIGKGRAGLIGVHDSLFGYRDRLSAGVYANRYSWTPFVDYNIPVNKYDGRLGASFSYNNAEVGRGDYKDFDIESRSQNYSIYYTHPIIRELHMELNNTTSYTYKRATTRISGVNVSRDKIPEFKDGLNFRYDTDNGVWYLAQSVSYAAPLFQDRIKYWKFEGSVTRLQNFGYRLLGNFRGNYQYIPEKNIPYADQMSAGGSGSVRGYSQGLLTAKSGYQLSAELYFPISPEKLELFGDTYYVDNYIRPFAFTDYAMLYPENSVGSTGKNRLVSTGAGVRVQLPYDIALKVAYGVPLKHNNLEKESGGKWVLELSYSPDLNSLFQ